jgi:hypothetical protein
MGGQKTSPLADAALLAYTCRNALRVFFLSALSKTEKVRKQSRSPPGACGWQRTETTVLYGCTNLVDGPLALLNGFNAIACLVMMVLAVWKRRTASKSDMHLPFASSSASFQRCLTERL